MTDEFLTKRNDAFTDDQMNISVTTGKKYPKAFSPILRMHEMLAIEGVTAATALLYMTLLWRAGKSLDLPINLAGVARLLGVERQSLYRSLKRLEETDLVIRVSEDDPRRRGSCCILFRSVEQVKEGHRTTPELEAQDYTREGC